MIRGWRMHPGWVALHDQRESSRATEKIVREQLSYSKEANDRNAAWVEEQRRHNAECHARKEAAGELTSQQPERHDH